MTTIIYCRQNSMYVSVCVCVCVCECVYMYICIYACIILKTCDKISSTDTSSNQLYMTCSYITINKTNKQKFAVVGGGT